MPLIIRPEAPNSPEAVALIDELETHLQSFGYPDYSRHGYSVDKLVRQGVVFFVMRLGAVPVGCGGIQLYDNYGEVKRMFVRPTYQRRGLAEAMLRRLAEHAKENGRTTLRLETGIHQIPAVKLYEKFGFHRCGPFGEYREDPNSIYLEMFVP
jgi:putative acetyltransferase